MLYILKNFKVLYISFMSFVKCQVYLPSHPAPRKPPGADRDSYWEGFTGKKMKGVCVCAHAHACACMHTHAQCVPVSELIPKPKI